MNQISGTTADGAAADSVGEPSTDGTAADAVGFRSRGRVRRRVRFLRKARELAYRDLGGLVFNLHRYGRRNDALVLAKLNTLGQIDGELRALEGTLDEHQPVTVLREAGITACSRCAAIHSSEDRFCPNCGVPIARQSDLPPAGAAQAAAPPPGEPASSPPAPAASEQPQPPQPQRPDTPATAAETQATPPPASEDERPTEIVRPPASTS